LDIRRTVWQGRRIPAQQRASFTSHCCTDLRQLYRLELHFRQGYAFTTTHDAADRGHPQGFQQRSLASLWFKGGKIIVYGTLV
jgi:hypothetical protein